MRYSWLLVLVIALVVCLLFNMPSAPGKTMIEPFVQSTSRYKITYYAEIKGPSKNVSLILPLPPNNSEVKWIRMFTSTLNVLGVDSYDLRSYNNHFQNVLQVNVVPPRRFLVEYEVEVYSGIFLNTSLRYSNVRSDLRVYENLTKITYWWNYSINIIKKTISFLKSKTLKRKDMTVAEVLSMIRNVTVSKLSYSPSGVRTHLSEALRRGTGDCSEYSDLYVTIARGLGIPAVRALGYIIENWNEALGEYEYYGHAWPLVYIPGYGWIPVEVTIEDRGKYPLPGSNTLDYLCIFIDDSIESTETWNPLNGSILISPNEEWFLGFNEPLKINNYTITVDVKVYPSINYTITTANVTANYFTYVVLLYSTLSLLIWILCCKVWRLKG